MRRALLVLVALCTGAAAHAAELPPVTVSFRQTATLRLEAVLGDYPWRHGAEVTTVGFAPDGKHFATVGGDRKIKLWEAKGAELRTFGPAKGRTYNALFSPDGQTLVTTSSAGTAVLWDVATGAQSLVLAHGAPVVAAAFFPDGKRLVTAARDRTVKVWDVGNGSLLSTGSFVADPDAGGPTPALLAVAVDRRGAVLVARADGSVAIVDAASGAVDETFQRPLDTEAAAFSAGGTRLLAEAGGDLHVLELPSRSDRLIAPAVGPAAALAISSDGRRGLFAGRDGRITVFDLDAAATLFTAPASAAEIVDVALSPDGAIALSASRDYSFRLWDVYAGRPVPHAAGRAIHALAFVGNGRIASGGADGEVRLWDLRARSADVLGKHAGAVYALAAFGAETVVSAGDDGTLRFFDLAAGSAQVVKAHPGGALAVAASQDGKRLVSGGADEKVRAWDPKKHRRLGVLDMSAPVAAVALSADGKRGVAGDDHGVVRLFSPASMQVVERLRGHDGLVLGAAFTADGKAVVTGSEDDTLRRSDVKTRSSLQLVGHHAAVTGVATTGDRYAFSAGKDGTVVVWDLAAGQAIDRLDLGASDDQPVAVAVAPDGKTLAVGTARGVILLYWFRPEQH